jgi:transposase
VDPELFKLFGLALGLVPPWQVTSVSFDDEAGRLDIRLDFPRGSRFACPEEGCGEGACPVHDTAEKTWRHLDFFEHQAYLVARVPRVQCPVHGVHLVGVPWARSGSGFTLLMEVAMLTYSRQMPMAAVARMARVHDTRAWRVVEHHVGLARSRLDFSEVTSLGMDETSARRGQDYVSIFMDLDERRVMFATPGRDAATVGAFATDLATHHGEPTTQFAEVCCDMSPAYITGISEHLSEQPSEDPPKDGTDPAGLAVAAPTGPDGPRLKPDEATGHHPQIVFDRYHVVAKMNEAVDQVRRAESKRRPELKGSRYVWLKKYADLTVRQRQDLLWLTRPSLHLETARAARWRDDFNSFYDKLNPEYAEVYLRRWCSGAKRSRLEPIKAFVRTVEEHWDGIIAWHRSKVSNGLLEATNSLIQAAKRRARGYRSKTKMITIIYLIAGKLPLPEIHTI